ncbi:hypothetical protein QM467_11375 [Rhodoblastus sp. 17X3]|uniref:hypothetical protein n=1 Tax=Rhodoblastus sp. 17X3 TaxID=3047026 RepID=UPI0024B63EC0|nr:hypothetical protein [Rhodoblastus sp. 17X3]MDI9848656.1 hypothetical protein [Rhodoblastus sp. 17X3]
MNEHAILEQVLTAELDCHAERVDLEKAPVAASRYVPKIPVAIIECVEQAGAMTAMGLILAIHRQLAMRKSDSTPLNAAIWKAAGSPSKKRREVILRNLAKVPDVFVLQQERSQQGHYRVGRGELWTNGR